MKTSFLVSLVVGVEMSVASAAVIAVPNGDFSNAANYGTATGSLFGGGQTFTPLGSGPWNVQTTGIAGLLAPPTASILAGAAQVTGLLGLGVIGQSNGAQFYQTLSGTSYLANTTYTLSASIDSGTALSLSLLGNNGIGLALTNGGNSNVVASSLTAGPGLVTLSPLGGSAYTLSLTYVSNGAPPVGDLGIRLYAGAGASLATANLLGNVMFDNVALTAVPEPGLAGLFVVGLCGIAVGHRRRRMAAKVLAVAAALMLVAAVPGRTALLGLLPNTTVPLPGVTLAANTAYEANVQVTTSDLKSLLGVLGSNGQPIDILDGAGNVLGTLTGEQLVEGLIGTDKIQLLNNAGGVLGLVSVSDLVDRLLGTSTSPLAVLDSAGNVLGTLPVTNLLNALLGGVLGGATNLDVLDGLGNVLGTVSVDKLLEAITGVDGGLTNTLRILLTTVGNEVLNPVLSVLDTPLLEIGNTTVNPAPIINNGKPNSRPTVRITSKKRKNGGEILIVRGTAADSDGSISRIQAQDNGRLRKVTGRGAWKVRVPLRLGVNRIKIAAIDNEATMGAAKSIRVVRNK